MVTRIRLGDIAKVTDDVENERVVGWFDGERSVSVVIRRQPGANILDVIDRVKALMPELSKSISPAIGFTIVSITASLLAVFIPILFMGGAIGALFREFAVVLAVSITVSGLISLTLTPMMCSRLLRHAPPNPGWFARALEASVDGLIRGYGFLLRGVLRHRFLMGLVTLATVVLTVWLYTKVPSGLFPQQDSGMITGTTQGPQDMSFEAMRTKQLELIAIVRADPDVQHINANAGGWGSSTMNTARMFVQLRPKPERTASADEIIARLRPKVAKVTGVQLFFQNVQDVRVGGRGSRTQYQYTLESAELADLETWGPRVLAALRKLPELKDVATDQQTARLQLNLEIDRDTAARHGITVAQIDNVLYDAFGQRQVATFYSEINQYRVVLEAAPSVGSGPMRSITSTSPAPPASRCRGRSSCARRRRTSHSRSATRGSSRR